MKTRRRTRLPLTRPASLNHPKSKQPVRMLKRPSIVEDAKARVAAVKESLAAQPTTPPSPAGVPKPPVKKKEEGPKPTDASSHPLVQKLKGKFGEAIGDASEFVGQLSVIVVQ